MTLSRIMVVAMLGLALAGCGRSESYRYKLTLTVDTPEGVKSAFNVVEVTAFEFNFPEHGVTGKVFGEAVYLDLGAGKRPLIALLTKKLPLGQSDYGDHWAEQSPGLILARFAGENVHTTPSLDVASRIARLKGPHAITTADLPDLVTFADIKTPKTVIAVDPDHLSTALAQEIRWRSMTIEVTNEALTTGIEKKLGWLPTYYDQMLDGHKPGAPNDNSLASHMNTGSFLMERH